MTQHIALKLDGEAFFLRQWLKAAARSFAYGIMCGQFSPAACHDRIETLAAGMASRAGFQRPVGEIIDPADMILEEIHAIESRIDRLTATIRAEIRPMIESYAGLNLIRARAHDCNGLAGFLLREDDVTEIVKTAISEAITPPRRDWRRRRYG